MKKIIGLIYICLIFSLFGLKAQKAYFIPDKPKKENDEQAENDKINQPPMLSGKSAREQKKDSITAPAKFGWTVDTRSGERKIKSDLSQSFKNFHQTSLVDGQGVAIEYLGNLGSPSQSRIFSERQETSIFPFLDPFNLYYKKSQDFTFYNVKVPYSNIFYQKGGGKIENEERLKAQMTLNSGKKFNIGFNIDYIYSRGAYAYLSNTQFTYDVYASYISDRYQMNAFVMNNYYNNSENGGILDHKYITDPNSLDLGRNPSSRDIPVNLQRMWNRLKGRQIFISNKYDIGFSEPKKNRDNSLDSINTNFVPVASFTLTSHYVDQQRTIASRDEVSVFSNLGPSVTATDTVYFKTREEYLDPNTGYDGSVVAGIVSKNDKPIHDRMSYWSFKNTFAMTLNEGFKDWVKFGLTAYIEQDFRKFLIPSSSFKAPLNGEVKSQNSTVIGGILHKQKGKFLTYNLKADLGVVGYNIGEFRAEGYIKTSIRFAGKEASVRAKAYIKNLKPTFFENHFRTKYFHWENDFSDVRRVFVGGEIVIPHTQTRISGGVENIDNYIYYGQDKLIAQHQGNIQVVTLRLDQNLKAGIFHWDNQIAYQVSSNTDVIPLPKLSLYSNMYLMTRIAKVLSLQLGVDAHFHTKYYAPGYEPVTLQFYNQRKVEIGNFPFATAYLNLNLKNTRFFMMMYNVAESMSNSEYFSLPNYPVNPMRFKLGVSWDFNN